MDNLNKQPIIYRNFDDSVYMKTWGKDGKIHREDGPAKIVYYKTGEVKREDWYRNGIKYRCDGPQHISYEIDGTISEYRWRLPDGFGCTFNDWLNDNRENIDSDLVVELKLLYG